MSKPSNASISKPATQQPQRVQIAWAYHGRLEPGMPLDGKLKRNRDRKWQLKGNGGVTPPGQIAHLFDVADSSTEQVCLLPSYQHTHAGCYTSGGIDVDTEPSVTKLVAATVTFKNTQTSPRQLALNAINVDKLACYLTTHLTPGQDGLRIICYTLADIHKAAAQLTRILLRDFTENGYGLTSEPLTETEVTVTAHPANKPILLYSTDRRVTSTFNGPFLSGQKYADPDKKYRLPINPHNGETAYCINADPDGEQQDNAPVETSPLPGTSRYQDSSISTEREYGIDDSYPRADPHLRASPTLARQLSKIGVDLRYNIRARRREIATPLHPQHQPIKNSDSLGRIFDTIKLERRELKYHKDKTVEGTKPYIWQKEHRADAVDAIFAQSHTDPFLAWSDREIERWDRDNLDSAELLLSKMLEECFTIAYTFPYPPQLDDNDFTADTHSSTDEADEAYIEAYFERKTELEQHLQQKKLIRWLSGRWLIAAYVRALKPGCSWDYLPILAGPQNIGKSTFIRLQLPREHLGEWYKGDFNLTHLGNKWKAVNASHDVLGKVLIETPEIAPWDRDTNEQIKGYLTDPYDNSALKWESSTTRPKLHVFIGTTNRTQILPPDPTGNRRYHVIPVKRKLTPTDITKHMQQNLHNYHSAARVIAEQQGQNALYLPKRLQPVAAKIAAHYTYTNIEAAEAAESMVSYYKQLLKADNTAGLDLMNQLDDYYLKYPHRKRVATRKIAAIFKMWGMIKKHTRNGNRWYFPD